jgi:hypothetical protein
MSHRLYKKRLEFIDSCKRSRDPCSNACLHLLNKAIFDSSFTQQTQFLIVKVEYTVFLQSLLQYSTDIPEVQDPESIFHSIADAQFNLNPTDFIFESIL